MPSSSSNNKKPTKPIREDVVICVDIKRSSSKKERPHSSRKRGTCVCEQPKEKADRIRATHEIHIVDQNESSNDSQSRDFQQNFNGRRHRSHKGSYVGIPKSADAVIIIDDEGSTKECRPRKYQQNFSERRKQPSTSVTNEIIHEEDTRSRDSSQQSYDSNSSSRRKKSSLASTSETIQEEDGRSLQSQQKTTGKRQQPSTSITNEITPEGDTRSRSSSQQSYDSNTSSRRKKSLLAGTSETIQEEDGGSLQSQQKVGAKRRLSWSDTDQQRPISSINEDAKDVSDTKNVQTPPASSMEVATNPPPSIRQRSKLVEADFNTLGSPRTSQYEVQGSVIYIPKSEGSQHVMQFDYQELNQTDLDKRTKSKEQPLTKTQASDVMATRNKSMMEAVNALFVEAEGPRGGSSKRRPPTPDASNKDAKLRPPSAGNKPSKKPKGKDGPQPKKPQSGDRKRREVKPSKPSKPSRGGGGEKGSGQPDRKMIYTYKIKSADSGLTFDPRKVYNFGEKGSGFQTKGEPQDFYQLRDRCLERGELFVDPEFPADDRSLFFSQRPDRRFEWRRPGEIADNPQLFVEGFSRFDVQQGELGDCWLLAAVANLTLYRRLFFQIVPDDQSFEENYAGIFHFRFWQYGRWIDVVIDDRLPTYRGQLVFLHSTESNEFWSALLEKAYAKLHGSYEALKGGSTCEAMEDFTGGVTEMYEMNAAPPNLFKIILKAYERASLMGCSIEPDPDVVEAQTREGLIRGHAYSITRVKYVDISTPNVAGKIPLLRLRNPWGNESEWNGPWSDRAPEWHYISDEEKQDLGLTFDDDGEFWMSFKDFTRHFSRLEICNLNPDSLSDDEMTGERNKKWEMSVFEGEWVRGVTAGGCRNFLDTFWHNPQYRVTLTEVDEGDDDGKCTMIVALMQKNRRQIRSKVGSDLLTIGFVIYHLRNVDRLPKPLDLNFFKYNASVARSPSFINLREVSCRFKLPPGTYAIIPSTFDPNEEGEFLLRVFSENKNNMEENDTDIGYGEIDKRAMPKPVTPKAGTKETEVLEALFKKVAGENEEIGWEQLKQILDEVSKKETPASANVRSKVAPAAAANQIVPRTEPPLENRQQAGGATAAQLQGGIIEGPATTTDTNNLLTAILALLCGTLCKDTPLADLMPQPQQQGQMLEEIYIAETRGKGFSKDVCRSMVAMLDADKSGKMGLAEFRVLWNSVMTWRNVFNLYDKDKSGALSGFELRDALKSAGYHLNNHILNVLMHRYGNKEAELEFDDFIMCAVKLKTMMDVFQAKDKNKTNTATFNIEEWIECTLYS